MSERREPAPVGDLIDLVLSRVAAANVAPIVRLRRQWDDVAGEWSVRCRPVAIRDGVLTVEVANGMDASLLKYATPQLLAAAAECLGDELVLSAISIRIQRR
jgi:predicted nucleic acid-binding Zn ribbon protein